MFGGELYLGCASVPVLPCMPGNARKLQLGMAGSVLKKFAGVARQHVYSHLLACSLALNEHLRCAGAIIILDRSGERCMVLEPLCHPEKE